MRENKICVDRSKKHKVTTDSSNKFNIAPNLLNRDFNADASKPKVGWRHQLSMNARGMVVFGGHLGFAFPARDRATCALEMAINLREPPQGCIHDTDRGSQYCSHDYQKILRGHGFKLSMSGKGNCYDNATVANFFQTITAELIWRQYWATRRAADLEFFNDINGVYNTRRKHAALGWKSPLAFERKVA